MIKFLRYSIPIILLILFLSGCSTETNTNLEEEVQKLTSENNSIKTENLKLQEQLNDKDYKISKLTFEIDELKTQYSDLLKQINNNSVKPVHVEVENPFNFDDLRVGYRVDGLTVTMVERYFGDENSYMINFAGEVTLTGTFINNPDGGYWNGIDFIVSDESLDKIPRLKSDSTVKFQISNSDVAEKIIGESIQQGKATITFSDYHMTRIPNKPTSYTANFVRLLELYED